MKKRKISLKDARFSVIKYLVITSLVVILVGLMFIPLFKNLNFGLDLQGGFEVLYSVKGVNGEKVSTSAVNNTYKTLLKRIDGLGISEPEISIEGNDKIRVGLAGVTDAETARNTLSKVANLSFRDVNDKLLMTSDVLKSGGAKVGQDSNGKPAVALSISKKEEFYKVTKRVSQMDDNRIAIWLDFDSTTDSLSSEGNKCGTSGSNCLSVATVSQGFASDVIIQGDFTGEEVEQLVDLINSGSLPTKLEEISSKTVSASFGEDSLQKTFVAGCVGVALIVLVLVALYRFSGLIASVGVIIYTFLTFLVFWLFGGVLTLPGIAAVVIGIGMAVDANVINFSRIKDELIKGNKLNMAYKLGNKNSFMSIFDSNLTTFLVAIILFIFGESSVRGFATMLIISIIVTMFVMVVLVRWMLGKFVKTGLFDNHINFFIGLSEKKIKSKKECKKFDFVKNRKWYYLGTCILLIIGIVSLVVNGLNLGIDFKGGTSITIDTNQKIANKNLNNDIKELGFELVSIEKLNDGSYQVKIAESLSKNEVIKTENYFNDKYSAKTNIGVISNLVKRQLVENAVISLILASFGIVIYISLRFRFSYAISSILALLHDAFMMIAIFSLFKLEVTSIFIAAILSIIGYSINDTIVTFDRIRENIDNRSKKIKTKEELADVVNISLSQTLTRSIITTVTTLIPVISLLVLGSHEIFNFNIALLFGLVAGVYSSIFIAAQLWYDIEKKNVGKPRKKKWYEEDNKKEVEELKIKGINS